MAEAETGRERKWDFLPALASAIETWNLKNCFASRPGTNDSVNTNLLSNCEMRLSCTVREEIILIENSEAEKC